MIENVTPSRSFQRSAISGGTSEPPVTTRSRLPSESPCASAPSIASIIDGTAMSAVARSRSIVSMALRGSKVTSGISALRVAIDPIAASTEPPQWNCGMPEQLRPWRRSSARAAKRRALSVSAPWRSIAPFGKPVVPEVNWIWARSPAVGARRSRAASSTSSASARNSSHDAPLPSGDSPSATWKRIVGTSRTASAAISHRLTPRFTGSTISALACAWRSTNATSDAR